MFELNIITTLLLLHTLLYMVGPKKSTILACGLFAFLSDRATGSQKFSWDKFNHLGLDNDERGGDSIGRMVGDTIDKFVSKKAKTTYQEYVINIKNGEPSHIALGHTRKASVGEISEATAQPVVLDLPDNQGKFVMIHNGTLHNWEDLAKKYNVDKRGKSDSMVFAEIIMNNGYDVLTEYVGTAALIIRDDREPDTLKVFKGLSKTHSSKLEEERPLYYYQESETSMYISSREEGLYFIGGDIDTVIDFDANKLYTIYAGQIVAQDGYDRTQCSQIKVWATSNNNSYGYGYGNNFSTRGVYRDEDFYNEYGTGGSTGWSVGRSLPAAQTEPLHIKKDFVVNPLNPKKIVTSRLRFYFFTDGKTPTYANGPINLSIYGFRNDGAKATGEKTYYFYAGILCKDKCAYDACKKECGKASKFDDSDKWVQRVVKYSMYPVCTLDSSNTTWENIRYWKEDAVEGQVQAPFFTGKVHPIFGTKTYDIQNGRLKAISYTTLSNAPNHDENSSTVSKEPASVVVKPEKSKVIHLYSCQCNECVEARKKVIEDLSYEPEYSEYERACSDYDDSMADFLETENEMLKTAINDGLQAILLAIDAFRCDLEVSGISTSAAKTAINNLSKLEDALLEETKFKKYNLITDYDKF